MINCITRLFRKRRQSIGVPTITINSATPSLVDLSFSGPSGFTDYEWDYDGDEQFNPVEGSGTGASANITDFGAGRIYVRVRGTSPSGQKTRYVFDDILLETQQLRSLTISASSVGTTATITHDCTASEPNVSTVNVYRGTSIGSLSLIDTFAPTTNDYTDNTITEGVDYFYQLEMVASSADYTNSTSNIASTTSTAPADAIDMEADHGMEAYYLPLDGRQFDDSLYGGVGTFDFPLANIEPLGNGTSRVTAVTNDGLGTTVNGVFDANVVGKTFVAIDAHLSGDLGAFSDEYLPNKVGSRYATVTSYDTVNGSWVIVDFEYNGGDAVTPQNSTNVYAYIGKDCSAEWNNVIADWRNLARPSKIVGQPMGRNGYVLNAYYIREFAQVNIDIAKDFHLATADGSPMRIKFGVEDRYMGAIMHFEDTGSRWTDAQEMFKFTSYANKFISQNVEWCAQHKPYKPTGRYLTTGSMTTGRVVVLGSRKREWDELNNGYGFDTDVFLWQLAVGALNASGSFTGSGETYDVDEFGFLVLKDCDFDGDNAMGATGGFTRGSHFNVYDNTTVNFNPQAKWVPFTQRMNIRFTTDFSDINNSGDQFDPSTHTDYLPPYCLETDGDFYATRYMGGNSRGTFLFVDKWIFPFNHTRFNQIDSYYNLCYNNNKAQTLPAGGTPAWPNDDAGKYTCSSIKALVEWQIPENGDVRTIQRQVNLKYPIAGSASTTTGERTANPTINSYSKDSIATHINWGLTFQKRAEDFTADELTYISYADSRRPIAVQPEDTFRILAWVEVDDDTGFAAGQSVTVRDGFNATIATGTIHEVDNTLFTRRIKIKSATANVELANNITNGTQTATVTAASNFDPTQVYEFIRRQGGQYVDGWNGVNGGGDGYGHGFAESPTARIEGYVPWTWIVYPDLPATITGAEGNNDENTTNVLFEIEVVNSQAAYLLDGQFREAQLTYRGIQRIGNTPLATYWLQINETTRGVEDKRRGVGVLYPGQTLVDNHFTDFLTDNSGPVTWPTGGDAQGHLSYNRAELTWYIRTPSDWQDTPYRQFLANMGNNSAPRYGGNTAYTTNDLSRWSKGYVLIGEVSGLGRLLMAESGSSRGQFATTQTLYDNNPSYVPQYAIREEMIPPNETGPFIPKVRIYGQTAIDWAATVPNDYANETVTDQNTNNAPDLPKTVRDILTEIGEI